jgi:hypothetical protein
MLTQEPEYQKLKPADKLALLRRTAKAYASSHHPEQRAAALRAEFKKIRQELGTKKGK